MTEAEPLVQLTRGKKGCRNFVWGPEQAFSFSKLKLMLAQAPILRFPDWKKVFWLETDASNVGIGAVLTQEVEGCEERMPVAYASRSLRSAEKNYLTTDKEGLAIVWAVKNFKSYIFGMHFKIVTDHSALKALQQKENLEGRLMRWAEYLMMYDFEILYRAGRENLVPDMLSRAFVVDEDPVLLDERDRAIKLNWLWIAPEKRLGVLQQAHRSYTGHLKTAKLFEFVRKRFYWTEMLKDMKELIGKCSVCAQLQTTVGYRPLRPIETHYPFEIVSLDTGHVTLPNGSREYFVIAVDHFTKWVEVQAFTQETSKNIMEFIAEEIIQRHGCPQKIQTDGGKPYVSQAIQDFLRNYGIKKTVTAAYRPESNGKAERIIQTLKQIMRNIRIGNHMNWRKALWIAVAGYRMVPHRGTGFSPFMMLYGREAGLPEEIGLVEYETYENYEEAVQSHVENLLEIHRIANYTNQVYWNKTKAYFDSKQIGNKAIEMFVREDLVWLDVRRQQYKSPKQAVKWIGPCQIVDITPGPLFDLEYHNGTTMQKFTRMAPPFMKLFLGEL